MSTWRTEFLEALNAHKNKDNIIKELQKIDGNFDGDFIDTYLNLDNESKEPILESEGYWNSLDDDTKDEITEVWNREFKEFINQHWS